MKTVQFNEFEKLHFDDLNDAQISIQSGVLEAFYELFNQQSGFVRSSFTPSWQSASVLQLSKGIAFYYDSSQTGYNSKYQPIVLPDDLDLTLGSAIWSAAPSSPNNRIDLIVVKPKIEVTNQEIRKVKSNGTGPIVDQLIDKEKTFTYEIDIIEGVASLSPIAPTMPDGYLKIAEVLVTGGSGIAAAADVSDSRSLLYAPAQNSVGVTTPSTYPFSLTKDMDGETILVDTSAARTVNLPQPTEGLRFSIKDSFGQAASNPITLGRFANEKIEGLNVNYLLESSWGSWTIVSDGTDWFIQ